MRRITGAACSAFVVVKTHAEQIASVILGVGRNVIGIMFVT